jgi:hypothetical protein
MNKFYLSQSHLKNKKFDAVFFKDDLIFDKPYKIIPFGAIKPNGEPYEDYTTHKNNKRKQLYLNRHQRNENWNEINPASLSRWILWNKKSLKSSILDFSKKFNLEFCGFI